MQLQILGALVLVSASAFGQTVDSSYSLAMLNKQFGPHFEIRDGKLVFSQAAIKLGNVAPVGTGSALTFAKNTDGLTSITILRDATGALLEVKVAATVKIPSAPEGVQVENLVKFRPQSTTKGTSILVPSSAISKVKEGPGQTELLKRIGYTGPSSGDVSVLTLDIDYCKALRTALGREKPYLEKTGGTPPEKTRVKRQEQEYQRGLESASRAIEVQKILDRVNAEHRDRLKKAYPGVHAEVKKGPLSTEANASSQCMLFEEDQKDLGYMNTFSEILDDKSIVWPGVSASPDSAQPKTESGSAR